MVPDCGIVIHCRSNTGSGVAGRGHALLFLRLYQYSIRLPACLPYEFRSLFFRGALPSIFMLGTSCIFTGEPAEATGAPDAHF